MAIDPALIEALQRLKKRAASLPERPMSAHEFLTLLLAELRAEPEKRGKKGS